MVGEIRKNYLAVLPSQARNGFGVVLTLLCQLQPQDCLAHLQWQHQLHVEAL
jgi:hypothetical protein